MESVILQDSPLAEYLEGVANERPPSAPSSPASLQCFAPTGLPARLSRIREKITPLALQTTSPSNGDLRRHRRQSHVLREHLVGPRCSEFLDQFRYIIIGSQLLNSNATAQGYNPRLSLQNDKPKGLGDPGRPSHTTAGLLCTGAAAFVLAWLTHIARGLWQRHTTFWQLVVSIVTVLALSIGLFYFAKRQMVAFARRRTIDAITEFVDNAQAWDGASAATVSLVQEVELVSRGYRISSPLPPVSRLEEQDQVRRCARLRKVLASRTSSLLRQYQESTKTLQTWTVEPDLERYYDIYEVSRTDKEELLASQDGSANDSEEPQSVKSIKFSLQRLHAVRKLFLCGLLSMDAKASGEGTAQYRAVNEALSCLSSICLDAASELDTILSDDTKFSAPQTPHEPRTPGHERVRMQLRKFTGLSRGIRELQAKIFLMREDSDRALGSTEDVTEIGNRMLEQYDAFGADLRNLIHEWEEGRSALTANINKHEQRMSLSPSALGMSRSTTPSSLGGLTAVGGSPAEALKILTGEVPQVSEMHISSDEELFEAVAMPRQRSTLPREERLVKMVEDRQRQAAAKEKAEATRHMVKELESVIKMRPRPKGLRTSM